MLFKQHGYKRKKMSFDEKFLSALFSGPTVKRDGVGGEKGVLIVVSLIMG